MKSNLTNMVGGLALLAAAGSAQASFLFDADGTGGTAGTVAIDTFDVSPTSVLGKGANQAIANFLNGSGPTTFGIYTQGKITGLLDSNNNNLLPNTLGGELTVVMGFQETIISATADQFGGFARFNTVSGGPNFIEIYFDTSPDSNRLAGTGFGADAGSTLIFSSNILGSSNLANTYTTDRTIAPTNLDSNTNDGNGDGNNNDWNNATTASTSQLTENGSGSNSAIKIENQIPPAFVNTDFFINLQSIVSAFFVDINLNTPFAGANSNDPMRQFITTAGAAAPDYVVWDGAAGSGTTLGLVNGGLEQLTDGTWVASGPDFLFSTDANINLSAITVPEPTVTALMGIGLLGLGFSSRKRNHFKLSI